MYELPPFHNFDLVGGEGVEVVDEEIDFGVGRGDVAGGALLIAGMIADATFVGHAVLLICTVSWAIYFVFFLGAIYFIPADIQHLHVQLLERAEETKA